VVNNDEQEVPTGSFEDEVLRPVWDVVVTGPITQRYGAQHLIWSYLALENRLYEASVRSLCLAHEHLGMDGEMPSTLRRLSETIQEGLVRQLQHAHR
jgi:hypothetical protein